MLLKRNTFVLINSLLIVVTVSGGCTSSPKSTPSKTSTAQEEKPAPHSVTKGEAKPILADAEKRQVLPTAECPSREDVLKSIANCRGIIDDTKLILQSTNKNDSAEQKSEFDEKIGAWRERHKQWAEENTILIDNSWLLLGARGVPVNPEIPLALDNLKQSGEWLEYSVRSAERGHRKASYAFLKSANLAADQASKLMKSRRRPNARTAVIKLPKSLVRQIPRN